MIPRSVASKVTFAVSAAITGGVALVVAIGWFRVDHEVMRLQLSQASHELVTSHDVLTALLDERFPGPYHLVAAPDPKPLRVFNGNGFYPHYQDEELVPQRLYKGRTPILGNPEVEAVLLVAAKMTGSDVTIAQRIPPRGSADPSVGAAPDGRAMRISTTVTRPDADGAPRRAVLTMMPLRAPETGEPAGAGVVLARGTSFEGRAQVAGVDSFTRYQALLDPDGHLVGVIFSGVPIAPFVAAAKRTSRRTSVDMVYVGLTAAGAAIIISMLLAGRLLRPLGKLRDHAARVGRGDFSARCDYLAPDEIGELAGSINRMTEDLAKNLDAERARMEEDKRRSEALQNDVDTLLEVVRRIGEGDLNQTVTVVGTDAIGQLGEGIQQLIDDLNVNVAAIARDADVLAAAAEELSTTSQKIAESSGQTSRQAAFASNAAKQVNRSAQTMTESAAQMTTSVTEISRSAQSATKTAAAAAQSAELTGEMIGRLGQRSAEIRQVVKLISAIADQTNLLALNATIEAARAGAAGQGFAVVANEVKELARETAEATTDITQRVQGIQESTHAAIQAIEEIRTTIRSVTETWGGVAEAVERQTVASNDIRRSVTEAANGTTEIAYNIESAAEAAQNTVLGVTDSLAAASSLSKMAIDLRAMVSRFQLAQNGDRSPGPRDQAQRTPALRGRRIVVAPPADARASKPARV